MESMGRTINLSKTQTLVSANDIKSQPVEYIDNVLRKPRIQSMKPGRELPSARDVAAAVFPNPLYNLGRRLLGGAGFTCEEIGLCGSRYSPLCFMYMA